MIRYSEFYPVAAEDGIKGTALAPVGVDDLGALATQDFVDFDTQVTGVGRPEPNADVTMVVSGPTSIDINYDYTGTTPSELFETYYYLRANTGIISSGTTLAYYRVLNGTVNGLNPTSGDYPLAYMVGRVVFVLASVESDSAIILLKIVRNNVVRTLNVTINKRRANIPTTTPVGSGVVGLPITQSGDFTPISTTTPSVISNTYTYTVPTGKSAIDISADLSVAPLNTNIPGQWQVIGYIQRNVGSVGTPVWQTISTSSTYNSYQSNQEDSSYAQELSKLSAENLEDYTFSTFMSPANIYHHYSDTGLTAGVAYEYRYLVSISPTRDHTVYGSISIVSV